MFIQNIEDFIRPNHPENQRVYIFSYSRTANLKKCVSIRGRVCEHSGRLPVRRVQYHSQERKVILNK